MDLLGLGPPDPIDFAELGERDPADLVRRPLGLDQPADQDRADADALDEAIDLAAAAADSLEQELMGSDEL